ncbi:MAG TPA: LysR substrate-binding domain-containing protein [Paenirhodobacter sp.]
MRSGAVSRLPPLKALQAFDAFGRVGAIGAAACELGVTPGAVSQQIHRLEDILSVQLVERDGRGLALTPLGRAYHAQLRRGFAALAEAGQVLRRAQDSDVIALSCLTTVLIKWIGRRISGWQRLTPQARMALAGSDEEPDLIAGEADFRISYGSGLPSPYQVELFTDCVVPACAPGLLAGRVLTDPGQIFDYPLLHIVWPKRFQSAPGWADWGWLIGGVPPAGGVSYNLSGSAIDAAIGGQGFVLAQMAFIGEELETGRLVVPFDRRLPLPQPYHLAWTPAALDKPHARAFHRWLLAEARTQGAISAWTDQRVPGSS